MTSRYRPLVLYSTLLAVATTAWLSHEIAGTTAFPPAWAAVLCIGACVFVWAFGLPAPRVGLTSMERVPQIGLLLVLDVPVAAALCGAASLIWPFVDRGYSLGSLKVAIVRGLHNSAMTALMLLAAGHVYFAAGGRRPLDSLVLADWWPLALMALTAQAVNVVLIALYFWLDGRDVRRIIRPVYSLLDLVFVPAGVLAAVLYNAGQQSVFLLFAALMIVFVLSFNGIGRALSVAETASAPLARLSRARRALHGARRLDELAERVLTETRVLFRFDQFQLALVDREQGVLDLRAHERSGDRLPREQVPLEGSLFASVIADAAPLLVGESAEQGGSMIVVPLIEEGSVIGLLALRHAQSGAYSDADLHLMQGLAEQIAASIADARAFEDLQDYRERLEQRVAARTRELEQANRDKERLISALGERTVTLERESQEDPLTGIANRRCFTRRLGAEIDVARTVGQPLTLAVGDLDQFKVVNDRLGHAVGDEVLRQSATLMRRMCRATDLVARIGGEEFALILPGMAHAAAIDFCEALRGAVESHDWSTLHPHLRVTLSIGLAQWDGAVDGAGLLETADARLYSAKRAGRNRVA